MTKNLFLSLGANLGKRKENIETAYELIELTIGEITHKSKFYENAAVGFDSDSLFLNTCVQVSTKKSPHEVLELLKSIEKQLGRQQKTIRNNYTSRPIDIDIIYYGEEVIAENDLSIPHLRFRERPFVLIPLFEIAPNHVDPISQLTTKQLLEMIL